jgi:quinol---cytochrome c reductase cytochrome b subunit, bacillus type
MSEVASSWTTRLRHRIVDIVPPGQWLPDRQPAYLTSWIYVFGVLTLAALIVVIGSGVVLTIGGVSWWHTSTLGHYVNSVHLWSVELLFVFMGVHFWGKFFMGAWRGRRTLTWISGVVAFVVTMFAGFTGYVSQTNFDAQWISTQAKDGINSMGIGGIVNALNPGQMLLWHIALLPLAVGMLAVVHVVLVRRHGIVPPYDLEPADLEQAGPEHADLESPAVAELRRERRQP